jgi:hypothetical protein
MRVALEVRQGPRPASFTSARWRRVLDLHQEPGVDAGVFVDLLDAHARTEGVGEVPDPLGPGLRSSAMSSSVGSVTPSARCDSSPWSRLQAAQGLLQRFLEIAADGHDLAHGLHLRGQARIGGVELLEGEARDLGDHVVDARLEGRRRGSAGDVVASSSSV